jgi:hypothetical protein
MLDGAEQLIMGNADRERFLLVAIENRRDEPLLAELGGAMAAGSFTFLGYQYDGVGHGCTHLAYAKQKGNTPVLGVP